MNERKRVFLLILIMATVSLLVSGSSITILYRTALDAQKARLIETAQSQARLIEAVARFDADYSQDYQQGSVQATISQIIDAHEHYEGFGETGEFTLARREGENIVFLLSHRHHDLSKPKPVPFNSVLAEPIRQALKGRSGTLIGPDYRGKVVLAAHEPVAELNLGIVAKIDLSEIRAPFMKAAVMALLFTLVVVMIGAGWFIRITAPIIKGLEERNAQLAKINAEMERQMQERKRAQKALKKSESRYRLLLENLPQRIFHKDRDLIYVSCNENYARDLRIKPDEITGKTDYDFFPKELAEKYRADDKRVMALGETESIEENYLKGGEETWVRTFKTPIKNEKGNITGILGIFWDISERKQFQESLRRAKEEAEAANRAKSEFLASMSHEIRTPMNAIIGMADLLWESPLTPEQQQYVQVFQSAGENLLNIINDILDISKVEAGELELEETAFDLAELVERACEIMAQRAHEKGLELNCQVMTDVPTQLMGDPVRLRQILFNLLGNAVKFTEKGEIFVQIERDESGCEDKVAGYVELVFSVSDTGAGIPPEKLDVIFDRFTQADASTTRKHGGTGLGLTISKQLIELMGGRIGVQSQVGQGSIFYFKARFKQTDKKVSKTDIKPPVKDLKGVKVLVVDDNATNRMILQEMLSAWGALVTVAEDGEHGIAEVKCALGSQDPYKLLLVDCRMPGMDGFQMVEGISKNPGGANMTIMMLTSDNRGDHITRCRDIGIAKYLVKPIKRIELFEAITVAISSKKTAPQEPHATAPDFPQDLRPLHILLVEDSEDNRLLVKAYLKKTPYRIEIAENGQAAVETFISGRYDLVLMDMQMPVMDGYSATRHIRKWEREKEANACPIIALTAYATMEEEQKSLDAGCTAHLTKPIKKAKLLKAIGNYSDTDRY